MHSPDGVRAMDEVMRIRKLTRQRRHSDALAAAAAMTAQQPTHRDALYLLAANQRCLNLIPEALETLARLEREHPRLCRLYQERGYCLLALRDPVRAIAAFQQGVALNPALMASWSALENLYLLIGDQQSAQAAGEQIANLQRLPPEVVQAGSLFSDGEFGAAEALIREYLLTDAANDAAQVEALRLLGRIEQQREALDAAERLFGEVLNLAPGYRAARVDLLHVLIARQKYAEARDELAGLLQLDAGNTDYRSLYATACAGLGDHDAAVEVYRELLAEPNSKPHLNLLLGHSLRAQGRRQQAIEAYRAALEARPNFGDAYWSLANLKTYRFSAAEIAHMQAALVSPATATADRLHLHFALGKALESAGRFEQSWSHYEQGNALKRAESRYRPEFAELNTQRQIAACTPQFFAERRGLGAHDSDPIFIVGVPRSGSTLVEQILASHSRVEGTQELSVIPRIVQELQGRSDPHDPRYPGALLNLSPEELRDLGQRYLAETRVFRRSAPARPLFIDKLPNNFRHIGLIHVMLPNAKIIDVRRSPMACCFSNFKQLFAAGQEFSYDMEFMARYYRTYIELMRHWDEVLPGRVHRVFHEDLIEDLPGNVGRLLDFCGLQYEPACIEFHNTERNIGTASSEQVRQSINREGLDQWQHYRSWLQPLENMLGHALLRYRE
ncbi:MAG TPA: sulfotransferase [Steroidobacteraceae bacterium]